MDTAAYETNETLSFDDIEQFSADLRLSALFRAAQISPQINCTTIGPNSTFKIENEHASDTISSRANIISAPKENSSPYQARFSKSPISARDLSDLKTRLSQKSNERFIEQEVRKQLVARRQQETKEYERINARLEAKHQEVVMQHKLKMEILEQKIKEVLRIEDQKEREYQLQKQQLVSQARTIKEQREREQRNKELNDNIRCYDEEFAKLEGSFIIIMQSCHPEMKSIVEMYKQQVEKIKAQKDGGQKTLDVIKNALNQLNSICEILLKQRCEYEEQLKAKQLLAQEKAQKEHDEAVKAEEAKARAIQAAEVPIQVQVVKPMPSSRDPRTQAQEVQQPVLSHAPSSLQHDNTHRYNQLIQFYSEKNNSTRDLAEGQQFIQLRFAIKHAIANPINMINEKNRTTLVEGFQKLHALLSGQRVSTPKGDISISDHPQAGDWSKILIAEKLIDRSVQDTNLTFYIAALVVALWQKFPDFGEIFQAKLMKECPFLLPHTPQIRTGQTEQQFQESWGYRFTNGSMELEDHYQGRTSKFATLMAAIFISHSKRGETVSNPFGIDSAWKYLASVVNLQPLPIYTHLLEKVLEIAGSSLHQCYGKQFVKLMFVLRDLYLPQLESMTDSQSRAAFDRLKNIIFSFFPAQKIADPKGKLVQNYW